MNKVKSIIFRTTEQDNIELDFKSSLFGMSKSNLIRQSVSHFWTTDSEKLKKLFVIYQNEPDKRKDIVYILFKHYRIRGFPYIQLSDEKQLQIMESLINGSSPLLDNDTLQSTTFGLNLANYYHPHMNEVKYSNSKHKSPVEMFNSDDGLKDCINRMMEIGDYPSSSNLRKILKNRNGVRSVSNFKPAIAKFIYKNYANDGMVLDPCSGYSGRLIGAIATNMGIQYDGIDPDGRTAVGNMKCAAFFTKYYNFKYTFHLGCAEDIMKGITTRYNLVFTSPPYFNIERYSEEDNQSFKRWPDYNSWLNNFLFEIVRQSLRLLLNSGYLVINVKNYKKYPIADDLLKYCMHSGFLLEKTYYMKLMNREFNLSKGNSFHTEPIFVFKKI